MAIADPRGHRDQLLFRRDYRGFSGGHLKVWHYFLHARDSRRYTPALYLTPGSHDDADCPWSGATPLPSWRPDDAGALFVAGLDWEAVPDEPRKPVVNLVQGIRHADPSDPRYRHLSRPAVRICVSDEVARAITATGLVDGPVHVIPAALDLSGLPPPAATRDIPLLLAGAKDPALARMLADGLRAHGAAVTVLTAPVPRPVFLGLLARADVALFLPFPEEGFFLPALEAMALGALVVCPDCVGNRSFCRDGITALVPPRDPTALLDAALTALALEEPRRRALRGAASTEADRHRLEEERRAFLAILDALPTTGAAA